MTDCPDIRPDSARVPRHLAIIMDGNGRWASRRHLPRIAGHKAGVTAVERVVRHCARRGIKVLTLFAFSSENWRRPIEEVGLLMNLFVSALERQVKRLHSNNVRLRVIGDVSAFNPKLRRRIEEGEALTAGNSGLNLIVAANYGGRWEITQAAKRLAERVAQGEIQPEDITPQALQECLTLQGVPDPDLFIRTGGEQRISNFLLWQLAYTEFYFTDILWPDFDDAQLEDALDSYASRQRRFGRTADQIVDVLES